VNQALWLGLGVGALGATAVVIGGRSRHVVRARVERAHEARFARSPGGVVVGAESIRLEGGTDRAVLLLHGFGDTPQSMPFLAGAFHAAGYTVYVPRLPGHGCDLRTMAREARASTWLAATETAYRQLRSSHAHVAVVGQSMGGALAVLLAGRYRDLAALVLLSPYLGMPWAMQARLAAAWVASPFLPYIASSGGETSLHDPVARAASLNPGVLTARTLTALRQVAEVAENTLPALTVPTLYLQSRVDNRIAAARAERCFAAIGSGEKRLHWLIGCGHIISADYCRIEVAAASVAWCDQHRARAQTAGAGTSLA